MTKIFFTLFLLAIMLTFDGYLVANLTKKPDVVMRDRLFSLRKNFSINPKFEGTSKEANKRIQTYLHTFLKTIQTTITQRRDVLYAQDLTNPGSDLVNDLRYSQGKIRDEMLKELSFLRDPKISREHLMSWLGEAATFVSTKIPENTINDDLWKVFQGTLGDFISVQMDQTGVRVKDNPKGGHYWISRGSLLSKECIKHTFSFNVIDKKCIQFTNDEIKMMHQLDLLVSHYLSRVIMLVTEGSLGNPEGIKAVLNEHAGWIKLRGQLFELYRSRGIDDKIIKMRLFSFMLQKIAFYERYYSYFSVPSITKRCTYKEPRYYTTMFDCEAVLKHQKSKK